MLKNKYFVIFCIITFETLTVFGLSHSCKKPKSKMQDSNVIKIEATKSYQIFNEKGRALDAIIFINKKMISGEATKELIVYFNTLPKPYVLLIAIPPKLIGIPERYDTMKISGNVLSLRKESLRFTPVNVGIEKMIGNWSIEDDLITFDTFESISSFGKRIVIRKLQKHNNLIWRNDIY